VKKLPSENSVIVAEGADHPALLTDSLEASSVRWIAGAPEPLAVRISFFFLLIPYAQSNNPHLLQEDKPFFCEYQVGSLRRSARCRVEKLTRDEASADHVVQFLDQPHW